MKKFLRTLVLFLSFLIVALIPVACSSNNETQKNDENTELNNNQYTIEFDSLGGSDVKSQYIQHGQKVIEPIAPTKDGYVFSGWYWEGNCQNEFDFVNTSVYYDFTIYAGWEHVSYNVTFDTCGGTVSESQVKATFYGDYKVREPIPCYKNHGFLGWYDENDDLFDFASVIVKDTILHAKWVENCLTYEMNGDFLMVTGCDDNASDVIVPKSFEGVRVCGIGADAFKDSNITSLVISDGVISIWQRAFQGCTNLSFVKTCNEMGTIGNDAFKDCTSLLSFEIPEGVLDIGHTIFSGCENLEEIIIPSSVKDMYLDAFSGCVNLKTIKINPNNKYYTSCDSTGKNINAIIKIADKSLLLGCENTEIPNGVETIVSSAFSGCKITKIEIPATVSSIDINTFKRTNKSLLCSLKVDPNNQVYTSRDEFGNEINGIIEIAANSLFLGCETTVIPNYVENIGEYAFYHHKNLTEITIPTNIKTIGKYAFCGCDALAKVSLSEGLVDIGPYSFDGCISLASIIFPESVKFIGEGAFFNTSIERVYLKPTVDELGYSQWDRNFGATYDVFNTTTLIVCDCVQSEAPSGWHGTFLVWADDVIDGDYVYRLFNNSYYAIIRYFGKDENVIVPTEFNGKVVKQIYFRAYMHNSSIKSVIIPKGITNIGDYAFCNCENLISVTIAADITYYGNFGYNAFDGDNSNMIIYCETSTYTNWNERWNCGFEVVYRNN